MMIHFCKRQCEIFFTKLLREVFLKKTEKQLSRVSINFSCKKNQIPVFTNTGIWFNTFIFYFKIIDFNYQKFVLKLVLIAPTVAYVL